MHRRTTLFLFVTVGLLLSGILIAVAPGGTAVRAAETAGAAALVPSTPRDFTMPGTQPDNLIHELASQRQCQSCHGNYVQYLQEIDQPPETETWHTWQGSMMAQAGRDPLFFAALDVANAGAANAGEYCLRCHLPNGWLNGRSSTPDGSAMTAEDREGVSCSVCHRLVDPANKEGAPARDAAILADLEMPVTFPGSGQQTVDPLDYRRGPFDVTADLGLDPHINVGAEETLVSPYHQESRFCGTCHDINNPMFTWDESSETFEPNELDEPGDIALGFPIERTFSEWEASAFNTPQGVYAPQFGGNRDFVRSCQDCHMRDITGAAGVFFGSNYVIRDNMPLHDLTGANTWVPQIIPLHPNYSSDFAEGTLRRAALDDGILRARYMLQHAARLDVYRQGQTLTVTIYNESGHKLPTGYVEGRRMWLQVEGYDAAGKLVFGSGAYDAATGELEGYGSDPDLKLYEAKQGLTESWAAQIGLPPGPSFHFALNNQIVSDNRIPPRGFTFDAFDAVQAAPYTNGRPDRSRYADGQYWDTNIYTLPPGVERGVVRLLFQVASKEYIEFLRDNNPNQDDPQNNGALLFNLWEQSGRSAPEVMAESRFAQEGGRQYLPALSRP